MQIHVNMRPNGSLNLSSTTIDNEAPMTITIRTTSDYQTLALLDSAREYIKEQGLRNHMIAVNINQILVDAGCKTLSQEQVKGLLTSAPDGRSVKGDEPLKHLNMALGV